MKIEEIKLPVKDELKKFDVFFKDITRSDIKLLDLVVNYMIRSKGKQLRPLFVFLSAKMHGEINRSTYLAATSIELLHSATLIHDDVVDESYERRGLFSINALWKNKISVLTGDYLLSKGLLIATNEKEYETLDIISTAVKDMSEGELLQFEKSRKLDIDEDTYFKIIRKKTASLIGSSMAVGTHSVCRNTEVIERMHQVGILTGLAFQIRDDIFDYQSKGSIGKPIGNDIKEKKITLPLIHVLNNATKAERKQILHIVKRKHNRDDKVKELIDLVVEKGGVEFATAKMNEISNQAKEMLQSFPQSDAQQSLLALIDYVVTRKK
jgi:octaprenyl-diphosphate synthase